MVQGQNEGDKPMTAPTIKTLIIEPAEIGQPLHSEAMNAARAEAISLGLASYWTEALNAEAARWSLHINPIGGRTNIGGGFTPTDPVWLLASAMERRAEREAYAATSAAKVRRTLHAVETYADGKPGLFNVRMAADELGSALDRKDGSAARRAAELDRLASGAPVVRALTRAIVAALAEAA